jgi:hypothetical protein
MTITAIDRYVSVDLWRGNFGTPKTDLHKQLASVLCWSKVFHYHWEVKRRHTKRGTDIYSAPHYHLKIWGKGGTFPMRSEHGIHVKSWARDLTGVMYHLQIVDGALGTPIKALFLES